MATEKPLTTDAAFEKLVNSDYLWSLTGLSLQDKRNNRHKINVGKGVTLDKKEELLAKAGFTVAQEKIWRDPK